MSDRFWFYVTPECRVTTSLLEAVMEQGRQYFFSTIEGSDLREKINPKVDERLERVPNGDFSPVWFSKFVSNITSELVKRDYNMSGEFKDAVSVLKTGGLCWESVLLAEVVAHVMAQRIKDIPNFEGSTQPVFLEVTNQLTGNKDFHAVLLMDFKTAKGTVRRVCDPINGVEDDAEKFVECEAKQAGIIVHSEVGSLQKTPLVWKL